MSRHMVTDISYILIVNRGGEMYPTVHTYKDHYDAKFAAEKMMEADLVIERIRVVKVRTTVDRETVAELTQGEIV